MTQTQIEILRSIPLVNFEKGYAEMASYGEKVTADPDVSRWSWNVGIIACTYMCSADSVTRGADMLDLDTKGDDPDELRMLRTLEKTQAGVAIGQYLLGPSGLHAVVHLELDPEEGQHPQLDAHVDELVRLKIAFGDAQPSLEDRQTAINLLITPLA